jgi:hypothetical protein
MPIIVSIFSLCLFVRGSTAFAQSFFTEADAWDSLISKHQEIENDRFDWNIKVSSLVNPDRFVINYRCEHYFSAEYENYCHWGFRYEYVVLKANCQEWDASQELTNLTGRDSNLGKRERETFEDINHDYCPDDYPDCDL